jgi:hypothetical protein
MSATIFLRRLWKILQLTMSIRPPKLYVNFISSPKTTIVRSQTAPSPSTLGKFRSDVPE